MLALDLEETQEPPTTDETPVPRRPSEPLQPGDRYLLGETIAWGGMGEVITAFDADIGRDVAIKRMRAPHPTPRALARFLREARIQGRLDHPAIVPVHELAYDDDGRPFFVMKKLSGTTLLDILTKEPARFSRHQLLRAFADVCLAIEFAHTRGVVHRDIKPANIVLGDFGEVYVLDWGIAKVEGDRERLQSEESSEDAKAMMTSPGLAIGTRGYMAPEQARGHSVDHRADIYSLGCVLFEILTGHMLNPRDKRGAGAWSWVDARPALCAAGVAPELVELCVYATSHDREVRLGSARVLAETVQQYVDGDRDVVLRTRIARTHLDAALAADDDEAGRRVAMREAGQALALDPTLKEAAELVGRLLIEPPQVMPREVAAELADLDRKAMPRHHWQLAMMHSSFLALIPILAAFGVRDLFYATAALVLGCAGLALTTIQVRTNRNLVIPEHVIVVLEFALLARAFTPFLVAPGVVAVNVIAFAHHPRAHRARTFWLCTVAGIVAVLAVVAAEMLGFTSPTMITEQGHLTLHSPIDGFAAFPTLPALCIQFVIFVMSTAIVGRGTARLAHASRERIHLQAWQVRQLVPDRETR
ncbi:MAG TPA: serine/threonine-protein kinase [Kofleriaceae bacterium]|nr:serine/threonine-protein kinase [Kofleriaceae bacterium]